ncbi:uncharacterized protein LOC130743892 [Lotus japonicus]|uniref:uncharacterized protein LOC130743892 n=1 Tax=Lotus japonicus TaxID=34305 RepID=UPI00258E5879|nr:uncharacterized protein LOC130743892 [Lotus japonicus]
MGAKKERFLPWSSSIYRSRHGRDLQINDEDLMNLCLIEIEKMLQTNGRTLKEWPSLPYPSFCETFRFENQFVADELNYNKDEMNALHQQLFCSLTSGQKGAYTQILNVVSSNNRGFFFLYEFGGSGKTFVWNTLSTALRSEGKIVLNVASSGIASLLLPRGRTAHSRFSIPITIHESSTCNVRQEIPSDLLVRESDNPLLELVNFAYPNVVNNLKNHAYFEQRALLAPTLESVEEVNNFMMSMIHGEETKYLNYDTPCRIVLKAGVPIMLIRNIDQSAGLCNGTRLIVTALTPYIIVATALFGSKTGKPVYIPRLILTPSDTGLPFKFSRRQFPITDCFAMTINKSQGQSLSHVGLYLPRPVFTHDHLYVALSRVKSRKGLKILIVNDKGVVSNCTRNVVYEEIQQTNNEDGSTSNKWNA